MNRLHPPTDRRCQIYITGKQTDEAHSRALDRCQNEGSHWEKWGGCLCGDPDSDVCEGDFWSWECDGEHAAEASP